MSSEVINVNERRGRSRYLKSLADLDAQIILDSGGDTSGSLFHQNVTVTITSETGVLTLTNDAFDMEFDVPFDDDVEANESEVVVFNLSERSIANIQKGDAITIIAGYGHDTGVIMQGFVSKVTTLLDDLDKVTTIYAIDDANRAEHALENVSYAAGTAASTILQDLASKVGLPIASVSIPEDHVYTDGYTVSGGLMSAIKDVAKVCNVSVYICKGQIYIRPITEGDALSFTLSAKTGLLSLSSFEEEVNVTLPDVKTTEEDKDANKITRSLKGYEMTMLLQHRVTTGSIITLESKSANGLFRVREGSHEYDGSDFITKVKCIEAPPTAPEQEQAAENTTPSDLPDLSGYSGVSIVDGLNSVGADSSMTNRKKIAEKLGIYNYTGTAAQNLEMLRKLGAKVD